MKNIFLSANADLKVLSCIKDLRIKLHKQDRMLNALYCQDKTFMTRKTTFLIQS